MDLQWVICFLCETLPTDHTYGHWQFCNLAKKSKIQQWKTLYVCVCLCMWVHVHACMHARMCVHTQHTRSGKRSGPHYCSWPACQTSKPVFGYQASCGWTDVICLVKGGARVKTILRKVVRCICTWSASLYTRIIISQLGQLAKNHQLINTSTCTLVIH